MLQKQSHKSHFVSQKCCILSLLILCFLFMILSGCGEADSTEKVGHRESTPISENSAANGDANQYWISAYYFAEGWAKNIWDCDMTNIDQQFVQIVNDGFNSVVLVVPWREFQPSTSPISYQEKVFDRLDWVMEKAEQHGLGVLLRVGYYWDQYQNESTDELAQRRIALMYDASMQQAWMEYIKKIYTLASKHDNYWGGFLCWEDFWTFVNNTKSGYNESENKELTKKIGYQDYIRENYSLGDYNQEFRTAYEDVDDILLPTADSPELKVFYDFYDHFLNQLLCNSQQVYPNLSMEVRTDSDPVVNAQGEQEWYSHEKTYSCGNSDYLSTMYGVFQGAENKGETMTAKETLQKTNWIIDTINGITGDKRMYINQFLFYDDTKGFSNNARVQDDQLDDYLTACVKILSQETGGYGIWTYQDYYFTRACLKNRKICTISTKS